MQAIIEDIHCFFYFRFKFCEILCFPFKTGILNFSLKLEFYVSVKNLEIQFFWNMKISVEFSVKKLELLNFLSKKLKLLNFP